MATSGTVSTTTFNNLKVIETAFRYCRVSPQKITAENLEVAKEQLYLLLSELVNRGTPLWTIQSASLAMVAGTGDYTQTTGTIDVLYLLYKSASNSAETPLARISLDTYAMLPNKTSQGRPTLFYVDRQLTPVVKLWPVPDTTAALDTLTVWTRRHIMDVGTFAQDTEVPQRWYAAIVAGLAWKLSLAIETIDPQIMQMTKGLWEEAFNLAMTEEYDNSPIMIAPDIGAYTI